MKTLNLIFVAILLVSVFATSCKKDTTIAPILVKNNEAPVPPVTTVKTDTTLRRVDFVFTPMTTKFSSWKKLLITVNHKGDSTYNLLVKGGSVGQLPSDYLTGTALTDFLTTASSNISKYPETLTLHLNENGESILIYSVTLHSGDNVSVIACGIVQNDLIKVRDYKIGSTVSIIPNMVNGNDQSSSFISGTVN